MKPISSTEAEIVLLDGVTVIVKAAHVRLCYRMLFVRAFRLPLSAS
jgi:hypothetical protein